MRRFLLLILASMMTISMMAVGAGTGKDKNNAIDFDWDGVSKPTVGTTSWYSIKLSGLSKEAENPTVALYLTNLTTEEANVELTGSAVLKFPSPISMFIKDIDLLQYTGNDATEQAKKFNEAIDIDGVILTKADADSKGGAALSIGYIIQKPILFLGMGQSYDDIKEYDADWMLEQIFS